MKFHLKQQYTVLFQGNFISEVYLLQEKSYLTFYTGQDFWRALYRPSCLIEAYVRPEKYWLVWAGPLAKHLNNFYFIFFSDGLTAAAERGACFADLDRH